MTSRRHKDSTRRLLKCFCGCKEMTEEEVRHIYRLNAQGTLIDQQSVQMLRSFLQLTNSGDKSSTAQHLDIYEQCNVYLMQNDSILTLDELDELCELGLSYHLEKELKEQIQTGDSSNIKRCLMRIQGECRNEIEVSAEYKAYKQALLDKLKQRH